MNKITHQFVRYILPFIFISVLVSDIHAEKPSLKRHEISARMGYAHTVGRIHGLTNASKSYKNDMRSGISWDADYYFYPIEELCIGAFYSGFTSEESHTGGSDHIYTHYFAPQMGLNCLNNALWRIRMNLGMGYIRYLNNSIVYEKDRKVTGGRLAGNIGLKGEYLFTPHWGLSLSMICIYSNLKEVDIDYHNETVKVKYRIGNRSSVSRLDISAGIHFHF